MPRPGGLTVDRPSPDRGRSRGIVAFFAPASQQIAARSHDPFCAAISYVVTRNAIGALGLMFPFVLLVGGGLDHVQTSLSAYYHFSQTRPGQYGAGTMRDAFVGLLCTIGAFLLFYRGHSLQEDLALNLSGVALVVVAFAPMDWPQGLVAAQPTEFARLHSFAAVTFFVTIGYVCVFRAHDTLAIVRDPARKRIFRRIYHFFGTVMLTTPAAVAVVDVLSSSRGSFATLVVEVLGVVTFAAFWLVKGIEIRKSLDDPHPVFSLSGE